MKIYIYEIKYDNKHFKPKWVVHYNIEEVEILNYTYNISNYCFRYKDELKVCCGLWELNGGSVLFCSLKKLTLNEIDKILNIYFKREHFMFKL